MSSFIFNGTRYCNDAALVASTNFFTLDICPTTNKNYVNVVRECESLTYDSESSCTSDCSLMQGVVGGSYWNGTTTYQKGNKKITIDCGDDAFIALDGISFGRTTTSAGCLDGASDPFSGKVEACDELDETHGWDYFEYVHKKCHAKNKCKLRRSNKMMKKAGVPKECQPIMSVDFYCVKNDAGVSKKWVKKTRKRALASAYYKPNEDDSDLFDELIDGINPAFGDFW